MTNPIRLSHKSRIIKKTLFFLVIFAFFALLEPTYFKGLTFAIPNHYGAKTPTAKITTNYPIIAEDAPATQQKSRAPEPSTLFLMLGGLGGMVVRFARKSFRKFKRLMDCFLAATGLFVTAPILAFAGLLIKLTSRGPIVYKQDRVGENSQIFRIYKLRTMIQNAEKETGPVWAKENDHRITPVGKILRLTHIDEIPQLFNVLKGEMSIIGPRPERPEMVRDFRNLILDYEKRLLVKPGITGIAQVKYKYDDSIEDVKQKLKYDLLYTRRMSAKVDLGILAQTFLVVLTGKGAR